MREIIGNTTATPTPSINVNDLGLEQDKATGLVYPTYQGVRSTHGIPLATTGGPGTNDMFQMHNASGWLYKKIQYGKDPGIKVSWSSQIDNIPTGKGMLTVVVNSVRRATKSIEQGEVPVEVGSYLAKGENTVDVTIMDAYANEFTLKYAIDTVDISISSYFDDAIPYTGDIYFQYTPVGDATKKVYFLVDGNSVGEDVVTESNRTKSFIIPAQSHGAHTLEVYFTATIEEEDVESDHLFYNLICYEEGNQTPIISTSFRQNSVSKYSTALIEYMVYTPETLTSTVELWEGDTKAKDLTVDRTVQKWPYRAITPGDIVLSIRSGGQTLEISFEVLDDAPEIVAETNNLELYLSCYGRDNREDNPLEWKYGEVSARLTGFNLKSDGWQLDEDNNTVLRVSGDARVYIPFYIFENDCRDTGKTIEIEFATRSVRDYDAEIISSWASNRGIKITAQKALLKSEQNEIYTQYKEDEHVRVSFVVEKGSKNKLMYIYTNGVMSGVVQYADNDNFAHSTSEPVGITIGSSECTTDIYCIRVYKNDLDRHWILKNWIADTGDLNSRLDRYERNNITDSYGKISVHDLPDNVPYLVLNAESYEALPQNENDELSISGFYKDPVRKDKSFSFEGAEIAIQGTSSLTYPRKNYKIKFKGGFTINGKISENYQLRSTSMPTNVFTFKADVASSEGANNVELAMLYDEVCPVKTYPQKQDSRVRQGIEGYPCLMFYFDGTNYNFIGKYNFNNDKGTPEVFGFASGDESWEIRLNNTDLALWQGDNFDGDEWQTTFKARYPDKSLECDNLAEFASWLKSTDTTAVESQAEKDERLRKFKDEFSDCCNVNAMIFNYIFTELFLMVDNRAKNAFPTRYAGDGKWIILPYDYDTALGINNEGELKFGYELEDIDLINGNNVYNGQDSVLYVNMRLAFADEIKEMYQTLRKNKAFSYEAIEKRFEDHQNVWGEAVFNEDAQFKYLDPLLNDGNETYLPMLQGSKAEQRKWWLYNRFRYMDSKYETADSLEDFIKVRPYGVSDIQVTPYADIYASAKFDSMFVKERAPRGKVTTLKNNLDGSRAADVLIYSASQLASVGDLSGLKVGQADFSKAIRLSNLKVGDTTPGYTNPNLTSLTIGNLTLLKELDVRNCTSLAQSVDLSGCANIETVYFDGTAITGVNLPDGGYLKTLHLPATITSLDIRNHKQLSDVSIPSFKNISTLRLEGISQSVIDGPFVVSQIKTRSRVRLIDVDWTVNNVTDVYALYDKLDTCIGLDEYGNNSNKAVITGVIHVDAVTQEDLDKFAERQPNVEIKYNRFGNVVKFMSGDAVFERQVVGEGGAISRPNGTPTKESTTQYDYVFKGWSLDGVNVVDSYGTMGSSDVTYYALFTEKVRKYTIRFFNGTTLLQLVMAEYGSTPAYTGSTPELIGGEFRGWIPEIGVVTGDADYTARFITSTITRDILTKSIEEYSDEEIVHVGDYAFRGCNSLTSINLPNAMEIGRDAFYGCNYIANVNIPKVTKIGNNAFTNCRGCLTNIDLPNVLDIGQNAFSNCSSLTSINLPNAANIGTDAFSSCSKLTDVSLPNAITIDTEAFVGCSNLKSISLPKVQKLTARVFNADRSLQSIYLPSVPPEIYSSTFNNIATTCIFYIPTGSLAAYQTANIWSSLTNTYSFVEEVR